MNMLTENLLNKSKSVKDEIYSKYSSLIKSSNDSYNHTISALGEDLKKNKRQVSAKALTDRMNYDNAYAAKGLARSGESAQARLLADNAATAAIGELSKNYANEKGRLVSEMNAAASKLAAEGTDKALAYEKDYISSYLGQKNADRDYDLAVKKQEAANKNADRDYDLAVKKQEAANKNADRDYYLAVKKLENDSKNADRNYELSSRKQYYDEINADRNYQLSADKQSGDSDIALLNYYLNVEKEKNDQKNKEKELLLELEKFNTDTAMANREYDLEKRKADYDHYIRVETLRAQEDQDYYENQIADQYLALARGKFLLTGK